MCLWRGLKDLVTNVTDIQASILVVDDEETIAELLARVLRRAGYQVVIATTGEQAWELFQARPFDVVLTDLRMPYVSGEQLTRRMKACAPDTQVIVLTGHGTPAE